MQSFVDAAVRLERCGFQGVELHGAHGYLLAQFLDRNLNKRSDGWGGSLQNRMSLIAQIATRIRSSCSSRFIIGLRFSPATEPQEGGFTLADSVRLMQSAKTWGIDFLHASLWNFRVVDADNKTYLSTLAENKPAGIPLIVAGKIVTPADADAALAMGADFVALGKIAIRHKDWPELARDEGFAPKMPPYSVAELRSQAVGPRFIEYLKRWPKFIGQER